ncbi:uncharacterized protein isoform X2 [Rhodnius prolixus]|uniref:uncharacterized protein isoform X2 n=1 Tax=Rhodnius prolixus TaxID=13249 RepID=UPI003D18D132
MLWKGFVGWLVAGGCRFPETWTGRWFQHGIDKPNIFLNQTHIENKGECIHTDGVNKFIVHDRQEKCYRCLVMYETHTNVLQYKETFCDREDSLELLCNQINGDALLLSMFRVDAKPVTCPFKSPPFAVEYSKGHGDCGRDGEPPSRAESCTDDTRLVFRFQACPDIPGTEAAVEELECLATWKESSNHYLVGRLHHRMATTDEQRYRCFIYQKSDPHTYQLGQSGEATCNGLLSLNDGSRTIKLKRIEATHTKCKFPSWVTQHCHWKSLDYSHNYHFSHRNASLKVTSQIGETETKLMCHTIITEKANIARLVVHVVSGCEGGYRCMTIHKRDSHVIQMQQSAIFTDPNEACSSFNEESSYSSNTITMISGKLPGNKCPMEGRYSTIPSKQETQLDFAFGEEVGASSKCGHHTSLQSLYVGCAPSQDTMEFQTNCRTVPTTSYSCHGSWRENSTTYVVVSPVSRHSTDAHHYCFIFNQIGSNILLQRVAETCAIASRTTEWMFNITEVGKCNETSGASQNNLRYLPIIVTFIILCVLYHNSQR